MPAWCRWRTWPVSLISATISTAPTLSCARSNSTATPPTTTTARTEPQGNRRKRRSKSRCPVDPDPNFATEKGHPP